jgi:DNA-binding transcriptional LysR family regulator
MNYFSYIQAFVEIVEQGSLHRAAQKLSQTDAAISKKLSKLEKSLNLRLLERGRNIFKLTPAGQQYYDLCREIIVKLETAEQFIQEMTLTPQGELRVTCNAYNAKHYLQPKLKKFLKKYPKILLNIDIAERVPDFSEPHMDILFGAGLQNAAADLVRKKLTVSRDILCATPSYLANHAVPKKPSDLLQLDYIVHSQRNPIDTIYFDNGETITIKKPLLKFSVGAAAISAALDDLGFIYIKSYFVEQELKDKVLVELLPSYTRTKMPIYVYYRHQSYIDPKIRAFMDFFVN